jgi:hypothetical protein
MIEATIITGICTGISLVILINRYRDINFLEYMGLLAWNSIFVLIGMIIGYNII